MLRTFIQVMAMSLVVISAFFLIKSVLLMSFAKVVSLLNRDWNYSVVEAKDLIKQRSDTLVGFILLLLSFMLSLINMLWPMRSSDFFANKLGIVFAILSSIVIFFSAMKWSNSLQEKWFNRVQEILDAESDTNDLAKKSKDE